MKKNVFIILALLASVYLFSYTKEGWFTTTAQKVFAKTETETPQIATKLKTVTLLPYLPLEVRDTKVYDIQNALMIVGYYKESIDGKMGVQTKKAIEGFQKANNLQIDGKVGTKTWSELRAQMIKKIQAALKDAGYYKASVDGKFGTFTETAIKDFQRDSNLQIDGKVGPKTWSELNHYLNDLNACLNIYNKIYEIMDHEYYKDVSSEQFEKFKDGIKSVFNQNKIWQQNKLDNFKYKNASLLVNRLKNSQDNYSYFLPPEESKKFEQGISERKGSLGIEEGQLIDPGFKITMIEPRSDSYEQGVRENDIIIKIGDELAKTFTNDQIIEKLHPKFFEKRKLRIISHKDSQEKEFFITCKEFIKKGVFLKKIEKPNIFCIEFKSFNEKLLDDLNEIFNDLRTKPISGIILDFRGNQGGILEFQNNKGETIYIIENLVGYFIAPANKLYYINTKSNRLTEFSSKESEFKHRYYNVPLIGLMNRSTASAAELALGVLKTYNRIILVGQNSQGAGFQKRHWTFREDGKQTSLMLVTSLFYLSNGSAFNNEGLNPDPGYEILDNGQVLTTAEDILDKRKGDKRDTP